MTATFPDLHMAPRLVAPGAAPADLATHHRRHGPLPPGDPESVLRAVAESGLTGRGGAGFPTYRKLVSVAEAGRRTGRAPVVVANGAEGEPASRKDKTLLRLSPHLVLDGLQSAAHMVGAAEAYLAVEDGATWLESALAQRTADPLPVKVVRLPKSFLSGQSSALARYVSGGAALPAHQRPPVRERGVHRAPTLVQNVETLAHLALIARYGADWYRTAGTPTQPGSVLCTVHVPAVNPGSWRPPTACPSPGCYPWRVPGRSWWAATTAPGSRPRRRVNSLSTQATWARESSPHCPPTAAASPRPPASCATSPCSRPASAAPVSTACPASPQPSAPSPPPAPMARSAPISPAGRASSRAGAPATTPTARSAWSAAP